MHLLLLIQLLYQLLLVLLMLVMDGHLLVLLLSSLMLGDVLCLGVLLLSEHSGLIGDSVLILQVVVLGIDGFQ